VKAPRTQRTTTCHLPQASADPRRADEERARSLSLEWGIAYVDLRQVHTPPDLLQRVPERLLLRHRVLPIALRGGKLRLAMANPLDVEAINETRLVTGYDVEPMVASETALLDTLQRRLAVPIRADSAATDPQGPPAEPIREAYLSGPSNPSDVLTALLDTARAHAASRIFLVPQTDGLAVRLRLRGAVRTEPTVPLPLADSVVEHIEELASLGPGPLLSPRQGRFPLDGGDQPTEVRVASYPTVMGDALVLRFCVRDESIAHLDRLGMGPDLEAQLTQLLRADAGLVLAAGLPGSGRSTTLYAAIEHLQAAGRAIFTIEEAIERPLPGVAQAQLDEATGLSCVAALRSLLGIEPDVVLIGEIHTPAEAVLAVQLARAGSLVLAGVLGTSAASVASHLASSELDPSLFAESLAGIIAQTIVRTLCTQCREPYRAAAATLEPVPTADADDSEQVTLYRAIGCSACGGTGYAGHTGLFELMSPDEKLRALIGARAPGEAIEHTALRGGMALIARHARTLLLDGRTTVEEVHHLLPHD